MEQVGISSGDSQTPRDHHSTTDLLDLELPSTNQGHGGEGGGQ
jgi:hypothetical protein